MEEPQQLELRGELPRFLIGARVTTHKKGGPVGTVQDVDQRTRHVWVRWDGDPVPPSWYRWVALKEAR